MWALSQPYVGPDRVERTRKGLVASLRLEPYEKRIVLPHELTHAGPKADRLRLLRSVRAELEPIFAWHEVAGGDRVAVGGVDISFSRTDHGVETLAVRIDGGGGSLGYSADSGPGWSLEALGPALDLALCEATLSSDEEGKVQHMSARQAGASARAAGARRLLLTHLWPTVDPVRSEAEGSEAFGAPAELAAHNVHYRVA